MEKTLTSEADKKNEESPDSSTELTIQDVGYRGRGVAREGKRVVFVPGVIEGEKVRARITHVHKRFADAQLLEVIEPSPQRKVPDCPLALRPSGEAGAPSYPCVGCAYQHVDYAAEVLLKQRQLASLLKRMAHLDDVPFEDPVASPLYLGYRNKITLHGGRFKGQPVLGYVGANNHSVLDVPACPLAHEVINARLAAMRAEEGWLASLRRSATVQLRYTAKDGVCESVRGVKRQSGNLTEASPLGDLTVPAGGFYQVNPAMADLLFGHVSGLIETSACGHVLDLFCGVGVFGLAAGMVGRSVLGVDSDTRAIQAARQNARDRSMEAVTFETDKVEDAVTSLLKRAPLNDTLLIVDPPRFGLDRRITEAIAAGTPRELVYVSCAPDTLARDLVRLSPVGYRIKQVRLFDMFPRTACFETVVHAVAP